MFLDQIKLTPQNSSPWAWRFIQDGGRNEKDLAWNHPKRGAGFSWFLCFISAQNLIEINESWVSVVLHFPLFLSFSRFGLGGMKLWHLGSKKQRSDSMSGNAWRAPTKRFSLESLWIFILSYISAQHVLPKLVNVANRNAACGLLGPYHGEC